MTDLHPDTQDKSKDKNTWTASTWIVISVLGAIILAEVAYFVLRVINSPSILSGV